MSHDQSPDAATHFTREDLTREDLAREDLAREDLTRESSTQVSSTQESFTQDHWDERYRSSDRLWSGEPNLQLVIQAAGLAPGHALDVGSGEGADAIWLASQGWTVTAADISAVALDRATRHAAARGADIAGRITWRREDLLSWHPGPERFDLVSAQFMHLPGAELESLHRRLTAAVRPGGTLLIVLHHLDDLQANVGRTWLGDTTQNQDGPGGGRLAPDSSFPTAQQLASRLDPGGWKIIVAAALARPATDLDGRPATVQDTVVRAVRQG